MLSENLQAGAKKLLSPTNRINHSILVASPGRSGSTVLYQSLAKATSKPPSWTRATAWDLRRSWCLPGMVYKTHAAAVDLPKRMRVIYVYREASKIVSSTSKMVRENGEAWASAHARHLLGQRAKSRSDWSAALLDELPTSDILDIAGNLRSWSNTKGVLLVKYDYMWELEEKIEDFLGTKVQLPEYRASDTKGHVVGYADYQTLYDDLPPILHT